MFRYPACDVTTCIQVSSSNVIIPPIADPISEVLFVSTGRPSNPVDKPRRTYQRVQLGEVSDGPPACQLYGGVSEKLT